MQERFRHQLTKRYPFLYQQKFIIAISGGIDSVVLAHLCKEEGLDFALAHCNFQLRGEESNDDELFVRQLAKKLEVPIWVAHFNTYKIAEERGLSIQLAARELRYTWFDELCVEKNYSYILVAHHLNDEVETFFINLLRGTGLEGLSGIPAQNDKIIRPLLSFSRKEISDYMQQRGYLWREDRTNATDHYLRNRIRHHITPLLEKENSNFLANFYHTQQHLKEAADLLADYREQLAKEITHIEGESRYFSIEKLQQHPHTQAVLYQLLYKYRFAAWNDIYALLTAQPGKQVFSNTYRLLKDRAYLVLTRRKAIEKKEILIAEGINVVNFPEGQLICENIHKVKYGNKRIAYIAPEKLEYPLKLRVWQPGDSFQPLGMEGHKKVSDFLRDEKLTLFEKEQVWVLLSGNTIIWVVGHRIHHAFRVNEKTTNILKIELKK